MPWGTDVNIETKTENCNLDFIHSKHIGKLPRIKSGHI